MILRCCFVRNGPQMCKVLKRTFINSFFFATLSLVLLSWFNPCFGLLSFASRYIIKMLAITQKHDQIPPSPVPQGFLSTSPSKRLNISFYYDITHLKVCTILTTNNSDNFKRTSVTCFGFVSVVC